jgi:hypothetical protein
MNFCIEVTTHWHGTLLSLKRFRDIKSLRLSRGEGADIRLDDSSLPEGVYELIQLDNQKLVIRSAPFMTITRNGKKVEGANVELSGNDVVRVQIGAIALTLKLVQSSAPLAHAFLENFEWRYAFLVLLLLLVQTALLMQIQMMPHREREPDLLKTPAVFRDVIVKMQKREKKRIAEQAASAGGAAPGTEGLIGQKDKPLKDMMPSKQGNKLAHEDTPVRSQTAALNMLKKLGLRNAGSVLGQGGLGVGAKNGLLGLRGTEVGIAGGNGGLGTKGTGPGGSGKSLGAGGLGSGTGVGLGGTGDIDLGGKGKGRTRIVPGNVSYEGGLTAEEIQRVVNRFMTQIKYCYDREVQANPDLIGKVAARWIIGPDGRVQTSNVVAPETTLQSSKVGDCLLTVVNRMVFPEPRGGGVVKVTFPFVFSVAGV